MDVDEQKTRKPIDQCCGCITCFIFLFLFFIFTTFDSRQMFDLFLIMPILSIIIIVGIILFCFINSLRQEKESTTNEYRKMDTYENRARYKRETRKIPVIMGFISPGYKEWLMKQGKIEHQKIQDSPERVVPERLPPAPSVPVRPRPPISQRPPISDNRRKKAQYCPFCGNKIEKGAKICQLCGSPID